MTDFLDKFISDKSFRRDPSSKFSIHHDKWDRKTADQIAEEVKDYASAERELGNYVETGYEAMNDTLLALFKANPHLKDSNDIRPSFRINQRVISEMMDLKEYDKNRLISVGDPIGAGLACATMEPQLEILFDKLKDAQKMAQDLESSLGEMEDYLDKLDDLMEEAQNAESEAEAQNFQDQIEQMQDAIEQLKQQMEGNSDQLDQELESQSGAIQQTLKEALDNANEAGEALADMQSWGLNAGNVRKLDPEARLALAKKLQTDKFRKMAEIFGRMQNMAQTEQLNRAEYATDEIYDLEQGADLTRIIPTELLALGDDMLVFDWLHRYVERTLVQYSLRGDESVVKGGIILLEDGSSSMSGTREVWSKAIGLALLKIAIMQKRPFYAINFSGPGQYIQFDFDTSANPVKMEQSLRDSPVQQLEGTDAIISFAESAMYGGTDFMTPLAKALDKLQKEFDEKGATEGDIVFLTDGECGLDNNFLRSFKAEQERLGFNVFGVAIQTNPKSEPFNTICDGKSIGLKQLTDIGDLRPLFSDI